MCRRRFCQRLRRPAPGWKFAWQYAPCEALAGDALNVFTLDDGPYRALCAGCQRSWDHRFAAGRHRDSAASETDGAGICGHDAMMMGPQRRPVQGSCRKAGTAVSLELDYRTVFYALLCGAECANARAYLRFGRAIPEPSGFPEDKPPRFLSRSGLPIGIGERYEQERVRLEPGDRIYLYSDGVTEALTPDVEQFGMRTPDRTAQSKIRLDLARSDLRMFASGRCKHWSSNLAEWDDVSVLAVEAIEVTGFCRGLFAIRASTGYSPLDASE